MATTSPDGISTPDAGNKFALPQDFAALAATIQAAFERRANTRVGSQTERLNTPGLKDGTFWKDTTGERILWLRDSGQWIRIWPAPDLNVLRIGSYDEILGTVFYNLRRLFQDGTTTAGSIELPGSYEDIGMTLSSWMDGDMTNAMYLRRNGEVGVRSGNQTRTLPFASAGGKVTIAPTGPNQITTAQISFPSGYFTQTPVLQLTAESGYPERVRLSSENVTTGGARINMHRTDSLTAVVHWSATQYREGSF